jgi:hypothetical protein
VGSGKADIPDPKQGKRPFDRHLLKDFLWVSFKGTVGKNHQKGKGKSPDGCDLFQKLLPALLPGQ